MNSVNAAVVILGGLASLTVVCGGVWALIRSAQRQRRSVEDNTAATKANTEAIARLTAKVESLDSKVDTLGFRQGLQGERLTVIEGAIRRNGHS